MTAALDPLAVPGLLYRVGRPPDVWAWPPWAAVTADGTFGNRWDDPLGRYRVLYTSCSRLGALVESLAPLRPDPALGTAYEGIAANDPDDPGAEPLGRLAPRWRERRVLGQGLTDGVHEPLVAVQGAASLSSLAPLARSCGIARLDADTLRRSRVRAFTQQVSRYVFGQRQPLSGRAYSGIFSQSFYGQDVENCALFERRSQPRPVSHVSREHVRATDADFVAACRRRGLTPA
jgi:hypothetical protein